MGKRSADYNIPFIGLCLIIGALLLVAVIVMIADVANGSETPEWEIIDGPEGWSDVATICVDGTRYAMTKDDVRAASSIAIKERC